MIDSEKQPVPFSFMGSIQKQIFFDASVEKTWSAFIDFSKSPEWVAGVIDSSPLSGEMGTAGQQWREIWEFMTQKIQVDHTLTLCETFQKIEIISQLPFGATMQKSLEFRPREAGSEVLVQVSWELGFIGSMIGEEAAADVMRKNLDLTAENWQRRVQSSSSEIS